MTLRVGSLFSGIGGFDLGLERTGGFRTVWFCEQDEFCQHVLAQHWPGVPCYPDITELRGSDVEPVDVLCGGFPCQDLSYAGAGAGLAGARSGLWLEYARLIGELRPRYVLVENVSALLARGLGTVLGDLAALGYDAEWDCIPASAVGAPHRRDRIWLVAYPQQGRRDDMADAAGPRLEGTGLRGRPAVNGAALADANEERRDGWAGQQRPAGRREPSDPGWWLAEPDVGRVADGVPARVDRLRALGNALVPQIAEWIGGRIIDFERGGVAVAALESSESPPQGSVYVEVLVTRRIALSTIVRHWTKEEAAQLVAGDQEARDELISQAASAALAGPDDIDVQVSHITINGVGS